MSGGNELSQVLRATELQRTCNITSSSSSCKSSSITAVREGSSGVCAWWLDPSDLRLLKYHRIGVCFFVSGFVILTVCDSSDILVTIGNFLFFSVKDHRHNITVALH